MHFYTHKYTNSHTYNTNFDFLQKATRSYTWTAQVKSEWKQRFSNSLDFNFIASKKFIFLSPDTTLTFLPLLLLLVFWEPSTQVNCISTSNWLILVQTNTSICCRMSLCENVCVGSIVLVKLSTEQTTTFLELDLADIAHQMSSGSLGTLTNDLWISLIVCALMYLLVCGGKTFFFLLSGVGAFASMYLLNAKMCAFSVFENFVARLVQLVESK